MLTDRQREQIEGNLLQEREDAVAALRRFFEDSAESLQQEAGELGVYRFHLADVGTEAMEREKQFLIASNEGRSLYDIDEGLRRLYQDPENFDRCQECGGDIGFERLHLVPETTRCAACQAAVESTSTPP